MKKIIPRYLEPLILNSLKEFPVVILTGARQVGKTTLAQKLLSSHWSAHYVSLDDFTIYSAAAEDPDGFLSGMPIPMVIDEVQRVPHLLRVIKMMVDKERTPGMFLLTGSANLMSFPKVKETLAGRAAIYELFPFSWGEKTDSPKSTIIPKLFSCKNTKEFLKKVSSLSSSETRGDIENEILWGGYPPVYFMKNPHNKRRWYASYLDAYVEREVRNFVNIHNLYDFHKLMALISQRTGELLNISALSRELGIPATTLKRYFALLLLTYQVVEIPPYYKRFGRRVVKMPRIYGTDTGILGYLAGKDVIKKRWGAMVETWVAEELIKWIKTEGDDYRIYFWRTHTGKEVDFILSYGDKLIGIEVKWSHKITGEDFKGLRNAQKEMGNIWHCSVVLYGGNNIVPFGKKEIAMPFSVLLKGDINT